MTTSTNKRKEPYGNQGTKDKGNPKRRNPDHQERFAKEYEGDWNPQTSGSETKDCRPFKGNEYPIKRTSYETKRYAPY
jgi:hypothetical protein